MAATRILISQGELSCGCLVNVWFYESEGQRVGPVTQSELARLLMGRSISATTLLWREGFSVWLPAGQTEMAAHVPTQNATSQPDPYSYNSPTPGLSPFISYVPDFKSTVGIGGLTANLFRVGAFFTAVSAGIFAYRLIQGNLATAWLGYGGGAMTPIDWVSFVVMIAGVVCFFMWLYGATRNLYSLGHKWLAITPGWAVGWFFVPLANLWKPYAALKQAHNHSFRADDGGLILQWWLLFAFGTFGGAFAFSLLNDAATADDVSGFKILAWAAVFTDLLLILAALIGADLIERISTQQDRSFAERR